MKPVVEPRCRLTRELADRFAIKARQYAEAVVLLTNGTMPKRERSEAVPPGAVGARLAGSKLASGDFAPGGGEAGAAAD